MRPPPPLLCKEGLGEVEASIQIKTHSGNYKGVERKNPYLPLAPVGRGEGEGCSLSPSTTAIQRC